MTFDRLPFALLAAGALGVMTPAIAAAQHGGTHAQQAENQQATATLRARFDATQSRVAAAQAGRKITRARATALRRQITQTRQSMNRLAAKQGFVSAGELASYNRTLGAIDVELDNRGVERSYGNDALPAGR